MKKKNYHKSSILVFVLSLILLTLGFYYEYIANPARIIKKSLTEIGNNMISTIEMFNFDTGITIDSTKKSTIKITANSSNYDSNIDITKLNKNLKPLNYSKLTQNLSDTTIELQTITNTKNKAKRVTFTSNLSGKSPLTLKKLIVNSTEYYYNSDVKKNYINLGNNTYFETVTAKNTPFDNFKHLYNISLESLSKDLTESLELTKHKEYNKISLSLDKENVDNILTNILTSLEKDEKSKIILSGYNQKINKKSLKNINKISKSATIQINIYTEKYTYKVKSYELIYKDKDEVIITYQTNNSTSGEGTIKVNNNLKYKYTYQKSPLSKEIIIYDKSNEKIGETSIEKTNTGIIFDSNTIINDTELNINYIHNILNLKKNKSYEEQQQLIIRSSVGENKSILNLTMTVTSSVTSKNKIDETTATSVIKGSLSKTEQQKLDNTYINIFNRLNS